VRALTRIATPETEAGLAEIARPMTGNQLERFARAHRQVSSADDAAARVQRRLTWRFEEDGSLAGTFRLPPLAGAVLLKALRAAAGDLEHQQAAGPEHPQTTQEADVSAASPDENQAPDADQPQPPTSTSLADALLLIAEAFVAGKVATADNPEVYQVVVHVGTDAIVPAGLLASSTRPTSRSRGRKRMCPALGRHSPPPRPTVRQPAAAACSGCAARVMSEGVAPGRQHNGCHDDMRNDMMSGTRHLPRHGTTRMVSGRRPALVKRR